MSRSFWFSCCLFNLARPHPPTSRRILILIRPRTRPLAGEFVAFVRFSEVLNSFPTMITTITVTITTITTMITTTITTMITTTITTMITTITTMITTITVTIRISYPTCFQSGGLCTHDVHSVLGTTLVSQPKRTGLKSHRRPVACCCCCCCCCCCFLLVLVVVCLVCYCCCCCCCWSAGRAAGCKLQSCFFVINSHV